MMSCSGNSWQRSAQRCGSGHCSLQRRSSTIFSLQGDQYHIKMDSRTAQKDCFVNAPSGLAITATSHSQLHSGMEDFCGEPSSAIDQTCCRNALS